MSYSEKTYFLRDAIHSDIAFETKFFALISTSEFQRLSRIKQLSSEYMVFPTALHNRFSHSIGTFFVMGKLIERLEDALKAHDVVVTSEQKDLALCSALLHDIGHGPFSHTFEKITGDYAHEYWTVQILQNEHTEIHQALRKNFGEDFISKLVGIFTDKNFKQEDTIITLISQLISSQMDADRMDYLLRDSYFTGVSTGLYDLHRLIEAIDVAKVDGRLRICVSEKYVSSIEEYIMARFYMHKEAYQHPLKRQLENIVQKIFLRAKELYLEGKEIYCDEIIVKLFEHRMDVDSYLQMDDGFLMYHIAKWKNQDDFVLHALCRAFVDRKKFERYRGEGTEKTLAERLNEIRLSQGKSEVDWEDEYCYIKDTVTIPIYDRRKDNIWVKLKSGEVVDITEGSYLFGNMNMEPFVRTNEYYHKGMLEHLFDIVLDKEL
ncbi:MAG: HD domain-containing protein [Peptostreptococcaceae bacterium]|nr:HD domain-containing protein [Peptostreptococcaceae bacterium]